MEPDRFLLVGTRIPVGQPLTRPIEPYNPARHGPASLSAPRPRVLRDAGIALTQLRARDESPRGPQAAQWGEAGFGVHFYNPADIPIENSQVRYYGLYGIVDAQLDISLPAPTGMTPRYLFAPSSALPAATCIEIGVLHWRPVGQGNRHEAFIRDWCDPQTFGATVIAYGLFGSFVNDYVRNYQGESTLSFSIVTPNQPPPQYGTCTYAHFYNYTVGAWVQFLESCKRPDSYRPLASSLPGRSSWVGISYATAASGCSNTPSIRSMELQVAYSTDFQYHPVWSGPVGYHLTGPCWQANGGTWTFDLPFITGGPGTSWRVKSPN